MSEPERRAALLACVWTIDQSHDGYRGDLHDSSAFSNVLDIRPHRPLPLLAVTLYVSKYDFWEVKTVTRVSQGAPRPLIRARHEANQNVSHMTLGPARPPPAPCHGRPATRRARMRRACAWPPAHRSGLSIAPLRSLGRRAPTLLRRTRLPPDARPSPHSLVWVACGVVGDRGAAWMRVPCPHPSPPPGQPHARAPPLRLAPPTALAHRFPRLLRMCAANQPKPTT